MPETPPTSGITPGSLQWNPDLVFSALAEPVRRRLLIALAQKNLQSATQLLPIGARTLDATLKHLVTMRAAGMVVPSPDPLDGRRQLYSISPAIKVLKSEDRVHLDFGFCNLWLW
ncbi:MAG: ArsR/SmtB family transcription factor [Limisphaerales bacterium]